MRRITLREDLQRLVAGSLLVFLVCAALAAWIAAGLQQVAPEDPEAWRVALCAIAALSLPFLLAASRARSFAASFASLDGIATALAAGTPAAVPAAIHTAELAAAAQRLVYAADTAQRRECALRSADRVKDEFLATLAHELRNPLSAMSAAAYLLRKTADDPAAQKATQVLARQVEHMNRLIEDLLDATRVTRGKVSLSRGPLDLAALVRKTVEEMRLAGRLDAHEVVTRLAETWVRADEARLQQVVANLVGNAVKYSPDGGRIAITLRRERDEAILRVQDNGIGMTPELAARAFDLFVQGQDQSRGGAPGLGIGLTLVRHLVELHGGKAFAASSGPGEGSAFTVTLPAIEKQAAWQPPEAPAAPAPSRHRILLVEDNADERETMFEALAHDGHRVYEAADSGGGMRAVQALRPDAAVIDIGSPYFDGFGIASALRHDPARGRMVLIALTGRERPETLRLAREAGFDEYLTKPIAPDFLLRAIDAAQARRRGRGAGDRAPA